MESDLEQARQAYLAGDLQAALGMLRRINEHQPGQAEVNLCMGQVHLKLGNYTEAQGWFQEASRLSQPELAPEAWEGFAECFLGRYPSHAQAVCWLRFAAEAFERHQKGEDALRCWRRVLQLQPDDSEARQRLEC